MKAIKILLAFLLAASFSVMTVCANENTNLQSVSSECVDGDINFDGVVDMNDAILLLQHSIFPDIYTLDYEGSVDFTCDGKVDMNDAVLLLQHSMFPELYPIEFFYIGSDMFTVVSTPNYCFNNSSDSLEYLPLGNDGDEGDVLLVSKDGMELFSNIEKIGEQYADLSSDEFVMLDCKATYRYEKRDGKYIIKDVISLVFDSEKAETSEAVGYFVDPKGEEDYYFDDVYSNKKKVAKTEGFMDIDGNRVYFYDAPYEYIKPDYNTVDYGKIKQEYGNMADLIISEIQYVMRNANNLKMIDVKALDEEGKYCCFIDETRPLDCAEDLITNLQRVYSKGKYVIEITDTNGDGVFDYIQYMPATYGFVNDDDEFVFSEDMTENAPVQVESKSICSMNAPFVPHIYTGGANIEGVEYEDGDFVLAYLNPKANYIRVLEVVEPVKGYVDSYKDQNVVFSVDDTDYTVALSYRAVEGFDDGDKSLYMSVGGKSFTKTQWYNYSGVYYFRHLAYYRSFQYMFDPELLEHEISVYACEIDGIKQKCVLYYEIDYNSTEFVKNNIAIPVSNEMYPAETYTRRVYDSELGDFVYTARLYYNNEVAYFPINVDVMYPRFEEIDDNGNYNIASAEGYDAESGYPMFNYAYLDKLCRTNLDEKGNMYLVPLLHAENDDAEYIGINRDSSVLVKEVIDGLYGNDLSYEMLGVINKVSEKRFELVDLYTDQTLLGDVFGYDGYTVKYFDVADDTRIIIKNIKERDEFDTSVILDFEYLEFDVNTFNSSTSRDTPLTNIQYVLKSNPDSTTTADLVILYAEAENFAFESEDEA